MENTKAEGITTEKELGKIYPYLWYKGTHIYVSLYVGRKKEVTTV